MLQLAALCGAAAIVVFRLVPWSKIRWPRKSSDALSTDLRTVATLLKDADDFTAWKRLVDLAND